MAAKILKFPESKKRTREMLELGTLLMNAGQMARTRLRSIEHVRESITSVGMVAYGHLSNAETAQEQLEHLMAAICAGFIMGETHEDIVQIERRREEYASRKKKGQRKRRMK